jgi:hypothetical protein
MVRKPVKELIKKLEDLHLQTEQALAELSQEVRSKSPAPPAINDFQVGDCVLITNMISHTLRSATDRIGIVKKVTRERVFFITGTGTHTCRARKNLQLVESPTGLYF